MNLSSIDSLKKHSGSNSVLLKMISKNKKIKGFHSKLKSEAQHRKKDFESDMEKPQKFMNEDNMHEKKTTPTKDRSIANILKESIENSLNNKIKVLEKDLKKKRIEFTIRNQEYSETITKLNEKRDHEAIKVLLYEMLNNPRYEFDLEELGNLKQRNVVIKDEFSKCLSLIRDDNLR